jgi:hypothetical protein
VDSIYFIIGGFFLQPKLLYSPSIAGGFLYAKANNKNSPFSVDGKGGILS